MLTLALIACASADPGGGGDRVGICEDRAAAIRGGSARLVAAGRGVDEAAQLEDALVPEGLFDPEKGTTLARIEFTDKANLLAPRKVTPAAIPPAVLDWIAAAEWDAGALEHLCRRRCTGVLAFHIGKVYVR